MYSTINPSRIRQLLANTLAIQAGLIGANAMLFLSNVLLARLVPPGEMGRVLLIISSYSLVVALAEAGIPAAVGRQVAAATDPASKAVMISRGIRALSLSGLIGLGAYLLAVPFVNGGIVHAPSTLPLYAAGLIIPSLLATRFMFSIFESLLIAHKQILPTFALELLRVILVALFCLAYPALSLLQLTAGWSVVHLAVCLFTALRLRTTLSTQAITLRIRTPGGIRTLFRTAVHFFPLTTIRLLLPMALPLMIGPILPLSDVSRFVVSFSLANLWLVLILPLSRAALPAASQAWNCTSPGHFHYLAGVALRLATLISVPMLLICLYWPHLLLGIFGKNFLMVEPLVRILCLAASLEGLRLVLDYLLASAQRERLAAALEWTRAGLILILLPTLTVHGGLRGAAWAVLLSAALPLVAKMLVLLRRPFRPIALRIGAHLLITATAAMLYKVGVVPLATSTVLVVALFLTTSLTVEDFRHIVPLLTAKKRLP